MKGSRTIAVVPLRPRSQRLYLYLLRPDGEPGAFQWIASANGFFPSLWRVLLSDAVPAPRVQRVLLSEADSWTGVEASVALARFRRFTALVLRHPNVDKVEGLERYLAAAERYLEETIADWQLAGAAPPWFCVDLAPLPDADPAIATPPDHLRELLEFREALDRILRDDDVLAIDDVLGFPQRNLRFEDWKAWSGMFGFAQLEPDYFAAAFRRPFDGDYVDHDYDELGSEPDLGGGCQRFKSGDRWGVRRMETIVLPAHWNRVLRTGIPSLVWVQRARLFGLAAITGQDSGSVLHAPDLDEVHAFVNGLARVRVGEAVGLLSADGTWYLHPCMDEIHAHAHGYAVIRLHGRAGYIDEKAAVVIAPAFDEADDFTAAGVARVRMGNHCGLIRSDGSFALPLQFTSIEWADEFAGWKCERDGVSMLAHADGSIWTGDWDAIEIFVPNELIRVRRGELYGLLKWDGSTLLACEFDELLTRDTRGIGPIGAQAKKSPPRLQRWRRGAAIRLPATNTLEVIARKNGLVGLIGSTGEQLIPFEFAYIDALEPHIENDQRLLTPQLMRVLSVPGKAAPRVGVWDIVQRRCIVPCAYDFVWTTLLGVADTYGFIVGNRNPKRGHGAKGRYRVGLLHSDGSVLVPQEYAWIAEVTPLNRDDAMVDLRSTLYHYWSRGEPVRAAVYQNGPMIGLPPPVLASVEDLRS